MKQRILAKRCTYAVARYWNWDRRYRFLATEVFPFWADVLASNTKEIIETEVKVCMADLKKDYKKDKHRYYQDPELSHPIHRRGIPNKFFFAVPIKMKEEALHYIFERHPKYGLLTIDDYEVRSVRRAKKLHTDYNEGLFESLIARASSQLVLLLGIQQALEREK